MTRLCGSLLLIAATLPTACGAADPIHSERAIEHPTEERSAIYPVEGPEAFTPCGWLRMPNGKTDYLPCPSTAARSPISDPPEDELDFTSPPVTDPRPDPPGDPPPM